MTLGLLFCNVTVSALQDVHMAFSVTGYAIHKISLYRLAYN